VAVQATAIRGARNRDLGFRVLRREANRCPCAKKIRKAPQRLRTVQEGPSEPRAQLSPLHLRGALNCELQFFDSAGFESHYSRCRAANTSCIARLPLQSPCGEALMPAASPPLPYFQRHRFAVSGMGIAPPHSAFRLGPESLHTAIFGSSYNGVDDLITVED